MAMARDPTMGSVSDIAEKIRFARAAGDTLGKVVFLIGAGCSMTAGIPGAADIARRMVREVGYRFDCCAADADHVAAYEGLTRKRAIEPCLKGKPSDAPTDETIDWYKIYDEMFRRHYTAPDDVRDLFGTLVKEADRATNWAHLCLGELVARGYISTVLTTNFDQLVLSGMVRAGVLPVVCDGIESLNRIAGAPRHPQLVELHGSRHTYLLRNAPEDVQAVRDDPEASAAIQKLLQHATTFVAIGYGGREHGVMDLLIQAAKVYRDKNLFWVNHSSDPSAITDKVREFLASSRNARLLTGEDADRFFLKLCGELGVGSPRAISQPLEALEHLIRDVLRSTALDPDIRAEIDAARARFDRLKAFDSRPTEGDPVDAMISAIRKRRLAGDYAEAYRLAEEALSS
jgi:hypothetical protein